MSEVGPGIRPAAAEVTAALTRRNWILLPAIVLLTGIFLVVATEGIARMLYTQSKTGAEKCLVFDDPITGVRGIPGCVCWEKTYENKGVEYRFNSSGFRSNLQFGQKPPGTYRIVLIGSSVAMGAEVPQPQTFAALLPKELARRTGRTVELYNEAIEGWGGTPHNIDLRFKKVLAAQPDLILWTLTPGDLTRVSEIMPSSQPVPSASPVNARNGIHAGLLDFTDPQGAFSKALDRSHLAVLLRHAFYQSPTLYANSETQGPLDEAGQQRLTSLETYASDMESQASSAGIPLAAVYLPNGQLGTRISIGQSMDPWPHDFNPYQFDDEVRPIIVRHGGTYLSVLQAFRTVPQPERGYFPVSGHPNARGQATLALLLADALTDGSVPSLKAVGTPQATPDKSR